MNDAHGCSNALPPFITKTYEMVDDPSTDAVVSWSQNNKSFIVWNPPELCGELLPRFFKHNNFSSFIRQLNTYGFRKIDPELWEFANEDFIKGQPHLLKSIHRRKPVHSHSMQNLTNNGSSAASSPLTESEKHIYKEKINNLQYEKESLSILFQEHQQEQKQIESEARGLTDRLKLAGKHQKEILCYLNEFLQKPALGNTNDGKRRLSGEDDKGQICHFDVPIRESITIDALLGLDNELVERLESSLVLWEGVLKEVEDDFDRNCETVKTAASEVTGDGVVGVNDVFWEQFLTENPGGDREKDSKWLDQFGKFWWNVKSVNNLVDQIGQLTPAGRT